MCPARCTPEAAAQLQPIPYACGAQRALLPIAVGAMNINELMNINEFVNINGVPAFENTYFMFFFQISKNMTFYVFLK